ncbi:retrovirus-related pol polyprotein from transposon TNT 1-94 [Tanacetum coccineum]|uniref:Retrovirus-related pol polyprotein from transposon TNT 1-94 n=1 Tax=Tanacetum coccineum TaxID=301880 RepID=A0ABQ5HT61_9ASTR
MQHPLPNNNYVPQPSFYTNYMQKPMPNPKDILDPTTAMNMTLIVGNQNGYNRVQNIGNQVVQNAVQNPAARVEGDIDEIAKMDQLSNVIFVEPSMEHNGGTLEQHPATVEEREKFDKLESGYKKSVYQEQCLTKKINALHLSYAKHIMTLNEEIANLNSQLSKEKSYVSYIQEKRKKLKDDFKTHEDELLDKLIESKKTIKELNNILVKTTSFAMKNDAYASQPKPDAFYHYLNILKSVIGYEKPSLSKQAQIKATEAGESLDMNKFLEYENERLLRVVVSQDIMTIVQNNSVVDTSDLHTELKRVVSTAKTRRPHPRSNTKNDRVPSLSKFMGIVRFGNDHVTAILGYGDLQWGNILIARVYFIEGLGHNMFLVGHFCDSDLEVAFWRNTCFVKNLKGVDPLKGNRTINLYTINLHEMAFASPICLMARATSTKSWLWHQRLSHLNFDTINELAKNDLVTGLPKFKYTKERLFSSYEQGKSKKAPHKPKIVPILKQRLHMLHKVLCGPMRVESINAKWYVLVIVNDYSRYTLVYFIRSKDKAPENGVVERRKRTLVEAARTMLIFFCASLFLWAEAIASACYTQNPSLIHRRFDKTAYELINSKKPDISFLHVFGALCYPRNDREDIGKLSAKAFNNGFCKRSSKAELQGMTSGHISSGLDLTYALLTITSQKPTYCEFDLLFEAIYDDYIGAQPSDATRIAHAVPEPQNLSTLNASTTTANSAPNPTNSYSQAPSKHFIGC